MDEKKETEIQLRKSYTHKKSGKLYVVIENGLYQNRKGKWKECVIYLTKDAFIGMEQHKMFVRKKEDFLKSFVLTSEIQN